MTRVRTERLAACPFSAAHEWVIDALRRRGLLCRRRADLTERGRAHDEVQVCPPSPFPHPLRATVRLRIERLSTRVIVEGDPGSPESARAVLDGILAGLVADLEARERARRAPGVALAQDAPAGTGVLSPR